MIKGFIKKSTLLYFIFCVYSAIFLGKYSAFSSVFISPSLTKPTAPGKIGSRQLDWNATDYGELNYQIPIQSPKLRQLEINLAVYYSPANSYSEAGPFWGLNIQKVSLDTRNGDTKFITSNSCSTSKADNLYVNKTKMISIGNGKWASQFNSGRDILQCSNSGFIFYKADGTIYEFGTTFESQISDAQGNAIEWYLTKVKTFQGLQEINYLYEKPLVDTQSINLKMVKNGQISENHFQLYSKPLLKSIQSDDVTIQVNYENTDFVNPHFIGGVYQVINSRIKDISVEKGGKKLKNYQMKLMLQIMDLLKLMKH